MFALNIIMSDRAVEGGELHPYNAVNVQDA
jgi:hypothetical protein